MHRISKLWSSENAESSAEAGVILPDLVRQLEEAGAQENEPVLNKASGMLKLVTQYESLTDIQKTMLQVQLLKEDPFFPAL